MDRLRRRSPSPALVVAFIALFVAAGGGGWAVAAQNSASTIRACVNKKSGAIRLAGRCSRTKERAISWNAAGQTGIQGPQGPTGPSNVFEADRDGGSGGAPDGTTQKIVTLANLPAGAYTITGKANVTRLGAGASVGSCTLEADADSDSANEALPTLNIGATVPTHLSHTFTATGTVTLSCTGIGGSWVADKAKVIAIRVGTLTRTAVTG